MEIRWFVLLLLQVFIIHVAKAGIIIDEKLLTAELQTTSTQQVTPENDSDPQPIGRKPYERLELDLYTGELKSSKKLPFDVPFVIHGKVPSEVIEIRAAFIDKRYYKGQSPLFFDVDKELCYVDEGIAECYGNPHSELSKKEHYNSYKKKLRLLKTWKANFFTVADASDNKHSFTFEVPALDANSDYEFFFSFIRKPSKDDIKDLTEVIEPQVSDLHKELMSSFVSGSMDMETFNSENASKLSKLRTDLSKALKTYYIDEYNTAIDLKNTKPLTQTGFDGVFWNEARLYGKESMAELFDRLRTAYNAYNNSRGPLGMKWQSFDTTKISPIKVLLAEYKDLKEDKKGPEIRAALNRLKILTLEEGQVYSKGESSITEGVLNALPLMNVWKQESQFDLAITNLQGFATFIDDFYKNLKLNEPEKIYFTESEYDDFITNLTDFRSIAIKLSNDIKKYKALFLEVEEVALTLSSSLIKNIQFEASLTLNSGAEFRTRAEWYVSADVGVAYAFYEPTFSNALVPYYGVNFNLFPINRQKKYSIFERRDHRRTRLKNILQNTSIVLGVSVNSTALGSGERTNALEGQTLLSGVGFRLSDAIRLSGGFIWNNIQDAGPLSTETSLEAFPYVSLSLDLDVGSGLKFLGKKIFGIN